MKKYAFVLIGLLGVSLIACDDQNVSPDSEENSFLDFASGGGGLGENGERQRPPKLTAVEVTSLSSTITDYISVNYAGYTVEKAGTDSFSNTVVKIESENDKKALIFDADGVFVEEVQRPARRGEGRGHGERPQLTEVAATDLPTTVTSYITANYADATIEKSGSDDDGKLHVVIKTADEVTILLFNADGNFEAERTPRQKRKRG